MDNSFAGLKAKDFYSERFGISTVESTVVDTETQAELNGENNAAVVPGKNKNKILIWFIIGVAVIVLFQMGGRK